MKFLLVFVACCGSPTAAAAAASSSSSSGPEIQEPSPPRAEETQSLVAVSQKYRRRKRGRLGGGGGGGASGSVSASGSASAAVWKPSLYAISEDNAVMEKRTETVVVSERMVKRKSGSHTKVHVGSYTDDYGRTPLPAVIPAFAPTAFLF